MGRQIGQSLGQFVVVFLTGMLIYKDWNAVVAVGLMNAIYQPLLQAALSAAGIWGISLIRKPDNGAKIVPVILLAALLGGCAGKPVDLKLDERTLANNAVAAVGEQATQTNDTYVRLCNAKVFTVKDCDKWREFYLEFQRVYPPAARSYQKAQAAGNEASAAAAVRQIKALSNELAIYYLTVKGK